MLRESPWARYAEWGARYSDLFAAALEEQGTLCIGIYRLLEEEEDTEDQVGIGFISILLQSTYFEDPGYPVLPGKQHGPAAHGPYYCSCPMEGGGEGEAGVEK